MVVQLRVWVSAAVVILIWGITFANTRALLEDFSALEIQLVRFALAWIALSCLKNRDNRSTHVSRILRQDKSSVSEWLFVGMGLTGVFVYQLLENCAIYYTNASNVAILVSFGPIVTAFLARLLTRDHSLSRRLIFGSLISICGVALVSMNGVLNFDMRPLGDFMALAAIGSWGLYSVLIDKVNRLGVPAVVATRKAFGWSLILMAPLVIFGLTKTGYTALDGSFSITLDWNANVTRFTDAMNLVNFGFLGLLASAASFAMWNFACRELGVVRTTIGLYLTPIVGVLFAALFLGECLTGMSALGGALILCGVIIATCRRMGEKNERAA